VTLRMPKKLKQSVVQHADQRDLSMNDVLVEAVGFWADLMLKITEAHTEVRSMALKDTYKEVIDLWWKRKGWLRSRRR